MITWPSHKCFRTALATWLLVVFLMPFWGGTVHAAETLRVRSGTHDEYTRFVFDWGIQTGYTATQDGDIIRIVFDRDAKPDFKAVFQQMPPGLLDIKSELDSDKTTTVVLTIDDAQRIRHFTLGNKVVLDVYHKAAGQPVMAQTAKEKTTEHMASTAESRRNSHKHAQSANKVSEKSVPEQPKSEQPLRLKAQKNEQQAISVAEKKAESKPGPVPKSVHNVPASTQSKRKTPVPETSDQKPRKPRVTARSESSALRAEPDKRKILIRGETIITVSQADGASLALFERHGYLWVVVGGVKAGAAPLVKGYLGRYLGTPKRVFAGQGVAYRYRMPPGAKVQVESGDLTWRIILSDKDNNVHVVSLNPKYDEVDGNNTLEVPFEDPGQPLRFVDPVAGDTLLVLPVKGFPERVGSSHRYTNFEVMPTFLGLALRAIGDDVAIEVSPRDGAHIMVPGGVRLSARSDQLVKGGAQDFTSGSSFLYDFVGWSQGGPLFLVKNLKVINDRLAQNLEDLNPQDLMTVAKLYVSNNRGPEALGVLRVIEQENPGIVDNADYIALRGVANVLSDRYDEAIKDLSLPAIEHEAEARIWRGYAAAREQKWGKAIEEFPADYKLISHYPDTLGPGISLAMAEAALRKGDSVLANDILDFTESGWRKLARNEEASLKYLKGEIQYQMGNDEEAMTLWRSLIHGKDRLYRAKASIKATELKYAIGQIGLDEAIEELDRLRYAWRGDALETNMLIRLGQLYFKNGQYREGFKTLRSSAAIAQTAFEREEITNQMTSEFARLYVHGGADELSPLEAVALYNEFSELTPAGPDGDKAIRQLAERLVQVDLLDRAAGLLEHQIKYRLKGAEAAAVGARLAAILLLDDQPRRALDALEATNISGLDQKLSSERRMLKARAFSLIGNPDKAIEVLSGLETEDAWRLRTDIYWRSQNWARAAEALNWLTSRFEIGPKGLSDEQANMIMSQAIAQTMAGDLAGIVTLRKRFGAAMEKTEQAPIFKIVTRSPKPGTLADRQTLQALVSEVDLFNGFLKQNASGG